MLRVIGDALIWSIVSKRTVIKLTVCLTAGAALAAGRSPYQRKERRSSKPEGDTAYSPLARPDYEWIGNWRRREVKKLAVVRSREREAQRAYLKW